MIITVGNVKGGSGKSTLATNLVVMRANSNRDVLLVDADEQGTASSFTSVRNANRTDKGSGYTSVRLLGEEIINSYRSLQSKYDDIIIDAGGRDTDSYRAALGVANVALIPFQPSSFDAWELGKVGKLVREIRVINQGLRAYTFINKADPRGHDNEDAADYASEIDHIEFIPVAIGNRKAFRRAAAAGLSVTELKPYDPKAIEEITSLYEFAFGQSLDAAANV